MAFNLKGFSGIVAEVSGTLFKSLKVQSMPLDYDVFGHYAYGGLTGVIPAALAANSEIFQFRWADPTRICLINEIKISTAVTTTMFAAGVPQQIDLIKSTGWSVAGTGGTAPTVAATLKKRTNMGSSLMVAGDMRIGTTAALGVGTKTLEAQALATIVQACPITASLYGGMIPPGTFLFRAGMSDGQHPIALVQNEGISIRSVAIPATGTWQAAISIDWTEVAAF